MRTSKYSEEQIIGFPGQWIRKMDLGSYPQSQWTKGARF